MKQPTLVCSLLITLMMCLSQANAQESVVQYNGLLRLNGAKIVNQHNEEVSLAGNSFFWSNNTWGGEKFYNAEVVSWLKDDWNSSIIRVAMGVEDPGGYLQFPDDNVAKIKKVIDAAIAEGIYVIIDWHSHYAHLHENEAIAFFEEMATLYGQHDHVIWEIYNEPLYEDPQTEIFATWDKHIKPYAVKVIAAIRAIDPDNLIIVGTGMWSQRVDDAAADPITQYDNIAYTLHFYTVYHQQGLRDIANAAIASGLPIFVTEWGPLGYVVQDSEADQWMNWCRDNQISHVAWSVNDKDEEWSILRPGASPIGGWPDDELTQSGLLEKNIIKHWPDLPPTILDADHEINHLEINKLDSGLIEISSNKVTSGSIEVIDLNGKRLFDFAGKLTSLQIDISNYPNGIYRIVILTDVGKQVKRIVKN